MAAVRPRSFSSQLLVGLSVFLHRRYGSKRLLHILSTSAFAVTYQEVLLYEVATVYQPQPDILSPESSVIIQYAADNADINVYTIDGYNTVHIMGVVKIVTPMSAVIAEEPIAKYKLTPTARNLAALENL